MTDALKKKLEELKEIGERATPGPWVYGEHTPGFLDNIPNNNFFCCTAHNHWQGLIEALEEAVDKASSHEPHCQLCEDMLGRMARKLGVTEVEGA